MQLLHRITDQIAIRRKQAAIKGGLNRQSARGLADLGLERNDIPAVARLGARVGPEGARLEEVVARVHAANPSSASLSDRLFTALARFSVDRATLAYQPSDLDRYVEEAHRLRAETMARFWRSFRQGLGELVRRVARAAADSQLGRHIRLELVWRRAHRQTRAELATYSDRELMTDLRLARSEIDEIAGAAADERVGAYVAANPSFRRAWTARSSLRHVHG